MSKRSCAGEFRSQQVPVGLKPISTFVYLEPIDAGIVGVCEIDQIWSYWHPLAEPQTNVDIRYYFVPNHDFRKSLRICSNRCDWALNFDWFPAHVTHVLKPGCYQYKGFSHTLNKAYVIDVTTLMFILRAELLVWLSRFPAMICQIVACFAQPNYMIPPMNAESAFKTFIGTADSCITLSRDIDFEYSEPFKLPYLDFSLLSD
jgi:hypothetical protein